MTQKFCNILLRAAEILHDRNSLSRGRYPVELGSILVVDALTQCALPYFVWELKVAQTDERSM